MASMEINSSFMTVHVGCIKFWFQQNYIVELLVLKFGVCVDVDMVIWMYVDVHYDGIF